MLLLCLLSFAGVLPNKNSYASHTRITYHICMYSTIRILLYILPNNIHPMASHRWHPNIHNIICICMHTKATHTLPFLPPPSRKSCRCQNPLHLPPILFTFFIYFFFFSFQMSNFAHPPHLHIAYASAVEKGINLMYSYS